MSGNRYFHRHRITPYHIISSHGINHDNPYFRMTMNLSHNQWHYKLFPVNLRTLTLTYTYIFIYLYIYLYRYIYIHLIIYLFVYQYTCILVLSLKAPNIMKYSTFLSILIYFTNDHDLINVFFQKIREISWTTEFQTSHHWTGIVQNNSNS